MLSGAITRLMVLLQQVTMPMEEQTLVLIVALSTMVKIQTEMTRMQMNQLKSLRAALKAFSRMKKLRNVRGRRKRLPRRSTTRTFSKMLMRKSRP